MVTKTVTFLFLLLISYIHIDASLGEASKPKCHNLPAGLIQMSHGVDITRLDLFPVGSSNESNSSNGFRSELFTFTCEGNATWNGKFQIPDQIDPKNGIQSLPASTVHSGFYQEAKQYKEALISQVGIDVHKEFGDNTFSSSEHYLEALKQFMNLSSVVEMSSYASAIKVNASAVPKRQLTDHFVNTIHNLTSRSSLSSYLKVIEQFGTHFFDVATLATGVAYQSSVIDKAYHGNESQALTNALAQFLNATNHSIDADFEANSVTKLYRYSDDGHLFEGHLVPIELLIEQIDQHKALEMKKASAYYRAVAYFEELKSVINLLNHTLGVDDSKHFGQIDQYLYHTEKYSDFLNELKIHVRYVEDLLEKVPRWRDEKLINQEKKVMAELSEQLSCALYIERDCYHYKSAEMQNLRSEMKNQKDAIEKMLYLTNIDNGQLRQLLRNTSSLVHSYGSKVFDFCHDSTGAFDEQCQKCIHHSADCAVTSMFGSKPTVCTSEKHKHSIGYRPWQINSNLCRFEKLAYRTTDEEEIRDRNLLKFNFDKMYNLQIQLIDCKYNLATRDCPSSPMHSEIAKQYNAWRDLYTKMHQLYEKKSHVPHTEAQSVNDELDKLVHYHNSTQVDICGGNLRCRECLECWTDIRYSFTGQGNPCSTEQEWHLIDYRPSKIRHEKCQAF